MEFLSDYGLFLAKTVTLVIATALVFFMIVSAAGMRQHRQPRGHLEVTKVNEVFDDLCEAMCDAVLPQEEMKAKHKQKKRDEKLAAKKRKRDKKEPSDVEDKKRRIFVTDFDGDIKASAVHTLKEAVTAVLSIAEPQDEVVLRLESPGGMVHGYGLAASQLRRITESGIPLTACVDKVAASGGYMMACVADKIVSAPFAIIGSIGVLAQLPNLHRLLKKNDVDYELFTAGEYKRTVTVFGENTEKGKQKFQEDLEDTHELFKEFVQSNREQVDIAKVATGEIWYGQRALDVKLVDELNTSDQYLFDRRHEADIFEVKYVYKKSVAEKLGLQTEAVLDRLIGRWLHPLTHRFFKF